MRITKFVTYISDGIKEVKYLTDSIALLCLYSAVIHARTQCHKKQFINVVPLVCINCLDNSSRPISKVFVSII